MKKLILGIVIIAVWLGVGASASLVYGDENSKNNVINVADFGAIPNDNQNDAALRKAVQACRDGRADTLLIPAGRYLLADEKAMKLQNDALHGRLGNIRSRIFSIRTSTTSLGSILPASVISTFRQKTLSCCATDGWSRFRWLKRKTSRSMV